VIVDLRRLSWLDFSQKRAMGLLQGTQRQKTSQIECTKKSWIFEPSLEVILLV
jgi:hypothetical protein